MTKRTNEVDRYIGNQLRMRRVELGLSQEKLALQLGITFQQIQKYEKGTNRIGGSRMYDIARILKVPIAYFYHGFEESYKDLTEISKPLSSSALRVAQQFEQLPAHFKPIISRLIRTCVNNKLTEEHHEQE